MNNPTLQFSTRNFGKLLEELPTFHVQNNNNKKNLFCVNKISGLG